MKNVFILGGTGRLGYHTTKELLKRGYSVSTISLPPCRPLETMKPGYAQADEQAAAKNKEHGIHVAFAAEIQNRDAYIDPNDTMPILKYKQADIRKAIVETIKKAIEYLNRKTPQISWLSPSFLVTTLFQRNISIAMNCSAAFLVYLWSNKVSTAKMR